jgi:cytochrome c-type biogenesis protein
MGNDAPLVFSFLAGVLAFLSPCIIPMITVYLSLITGVTMGNLEQLRLSETRRRIMVSTVFFVLGFGLIFTLAGGAASSVGQVFRSYIGWLNLIGGISVIALGLHMAGVFKLGALRYLDLSRRLKFPQKAIGAKGAFLVGIFFAIVCSHCIGPFLYSMLIYAGVSGSVSQGAAALALFSLGLAVPYLITAVGITRMVDYLQAFKKKARIVTAVSGASLVIFGLLMASNKFLLLSQVVGRILPYKLPGAM